MKFYKIGDILPEVARNYNLDIVLEIFELLKQFLPERVFTLIEGIKVDDADLIINVKNDSTGRSELRLYKEELLKRLNESLKDRYQFESLIIK